MKNIVFMLVLWGICMPVFGQNELSTKSKKAIGYYMESENYMVRRQFNEALQLLDMALDKDKKFIEAYGRKAYIHTLVREPEAAKFNYQQIIALAPEDPQYSNAYYYLAEIALNEGSYSEAENMVNKFLSITPVQRDLLPHAARIEKNIEFARDNQDNPLAFKPHPLPKEVNNIMLQYFPVLTADQQKIFFTGRKGLISAKYDEDIYYCEKDENGKWSTPRSISENINTPYNEGTCSISADGRTLIFTSCQGRRSYGSCDLFITYKVGDEWTKPQNLGSEVNSRFWESQPSLTADGRTLYFVSSRPGGEGKRDIYVTYLRKDGTWSRPVNLGKPVNTEADEVSPFIHANGQTMFFSSDGHPGFGSFDLFSTELKDNAWQEPKNLGYPINTYEEQVSLFVTADGKKGYYSNENLNSRVGAKSMIYEFDIPEEIQVTNKTNYVKGRIFDSETNDFISANVDLIRLSDKNLLSSIQSDKNSGEYLMVITEGDEYGLYVTKPGYLFKSLSFDYQLEKQTEPLVIDIYLDPIQKGSATVLSNIFFEFDKYELMNKSYAELEKVKDFLEENPAVSIGIAGHTDNEGNADYNKTLSLNRAKSVYNYLVEQGISEDRLKYRGFGAEKPVVPNDTEENRSKNRRIEFEIL